MTTKIKCLIPHEIQLVNRGMKTDEERMKELYEYSLKNILYHPRYAEYVCFYKKHLKEIENNNKE